MESFCVCPARLDLGHGGSTFPNTGSAHVNARTAAVEEAEEGGNGEQREGEPEEGSGCLRLATAAGSVASTICDMIC